MRESHAGWRGGWQVISRAGALMGFLRRHAAVAIAWPCLLSSSAIRCHLVSGTVLCIKPPQPPPRVSHCQMEGGGNQRLGVGEGRCQINRGVGKEGWGGRSEGREGGRGMQEPGRGMGVWSLTEEE